MKRRERDVVASMFLPAAIVMIFTQMTGVVANIIDGVITSRFLGPDAYSAVSLLGPLVNIVLLLASFISIGGQIVCSHKIGTGRRDEANAVFTFSALFGLVISALFVLLSVASPSMLFRVCGVSLDTRPELYGHMLSYLRGYLFGIPAVILTQVLSPFLVMDDGKRLVTLSATVLCVADIVGDLTGMGIDNLNVRVSGWCNGGVSQKVLTRVKVLNQLGGQAGMKKLIQAAGDDGANLYFDGISCFAYDSGLTNGFIARRDAARYTTRELVELYPYSAITYQADASLDHYYLVQPGFAQRMAQNLTDYLSKNQAYGVAFRDIGNLLSGDYNVKNRVTREQAMQMDIDTVKRAKELGFHHIVSFKQNKGLAKGFMAGIDACLHLGADIIVNTDADVISKFLFLISFFTCSKIASSLRFCSLSIAAQISFSLSSNFLRNSRTSTSSAFLRSNFFSIALNEICFINFSSKLFIPAAFPICFCSPSTFPTNFAH